MSLATVLIVAGGLLQFLGVAEVAREVRASRRAALRYRARPQTVFPAGIPAITSFGRATVGTGQEPSVSDRLDQLEQHVSELQDNLAKAREDLRKEARESSEDAAQRVERWTQDQLRAIGGFLEELATGGIKYRWAGVVSILAGIILMTVGSVLP